MDSNELKRACKMAGLFQAMHGQWYMPTEPAYAHFEDDAALEPYISELLTQKVRELGLGERLEDEIALASPVGDEADFPVLATASQKIRACMRVLGGGGEHDGQ